MNTELETFEKRFIQNFKNKKKLNLVISFLIVVLGITSFIYKAKYEGGVLTCFREMTVCGTVFASIVALQYFFISLYELIKDKEFESKYLYYIRLSSATTEFIILVIVLIGYLPFIPANPIIGRYDMINMHVLVPVLTMFSFIFNDPPRGKLTKVQLLNGEIFLVLYGVSIITCILIGIVPEDKIPYFFLNVKNNSIFFSILAMIVFFSLGYALSFLFYKLNKKGSWLWYKI